VETLRKAIEEVRKRCSPEETGADVAARIAEEIRMLHEEARTDDGLLDVARHSYERCVAEAIVAYSETWLGEPVSSVEPPADASAERDRYYAACVADGTPSSFCSCSADLAVDLLGKSFLGALADLWPSGSIPPEQLAAATGLSVAEAQAKVENWFDASLAQCPF
jgi:hypothetical protein